MPASSYRNKTEAQSPSIAIPAHACGNGHRGLRSFRGPIMRHAQRLSVLGKHMRQISAREAVRNFRSAGDAAKWSIMAAESAALGYEHVEGDMGGARVFTDALRIKVKPKFTLGEFPNVFTSGSCFAREIELAFFEAGVPVLSWHPERTTPNHAFHRYNTFSIQNDFNFAFDNNYDEQLAMETPVGWADYSSTGIFPTREELLDIRHQTIDVHRNIGQADVFIVTLGLIEAWFDKASGTYLNAVPSEVLAGNLSRFECRITDYQENLDALRGLIAYLRGRVREDLKVIVTVSPVPLSATFSGQDIVQANSLSKATLRAVAQAVTDADPLVDYFPSYEIVTLSDPAIAWLPDRRHVQRSTVAHIVQTFRDAYIIPAEATMSSAA